MGEEEKEEKEEKEQAVPGESKADKFKRLATKRVTRANKCIDLIGNLSTSQYEYTQEQVDTIVQTLSEHINSVQDRFAKRGKKEKTFSL